MRTATISKKFTFHAAHRLPHHDGPCRDLHGHSYVLEVAVTGPVKVADGSSDEGMVMDFGEVKKVYKAFIEPKVEHKFLNHTLAGELPATTAEPEGEEPIDGIPLTTSENLAAWMQEVFEGGLIGHERRNASVPTTVSVRLWETPTSFAEAGPTPWRKS